MRSVKRLMKVLFRGHDRRRLEVLCSRLRGASSLEEEVGILRESGVRVLTDPLVVEALRRRARGGECKIGVQFLCLFDGLGKDDVWSIVSLVYHAIGHERYADVMVGLVEEATMLIELARVCAGGVDARRV